MASSNKQADWDKAGENVVVLHQFPRGKKGPNFSPYCLKLETFLRVHKISYIVEEDHALKGPTKQAPWMTFNGENTGDSQVCIELLADKFQVDVNPGLSEADKAVSKAFQVLLEDRLIPIMALERFAFFKWDDFKDITQPFIPPMLRFASNFIWSRIGKGTRKNSPFGRLNHEQLASKALGLMQSLSDYLSTKPFFFGDQMTLFDIIFFGLSTQLLFMSPEQSKLRVSLESLENLVRHNKAIRDQVFPDWEDLLVK